jgi:ribosomal protein S18 acetylase RimI-like enzyme
MDVAFKYSIIHVPHDEAGIRKYLEDYKALRLFSLKYAPEAFASTYAREIAFEDNVWYGRLSNPIANTFMAIGEAGQLISMSTINGPLSIGTCDMPPLGIPQTVHGAWDGTDPLHFRVNAVFTMPEARRKGLSKAVIERSIKYIMDEAQTRNRETIFSVIVDTDNLPARALYESVGFVEVIRLGPSKNIYGLPVIILEYRPSSALAKVGET